MNYEHEIKIENILTQLNKKASSLKENNYELNNMIYSIQSLKKVASTTESSKIENYLDKKSEEIKKLLEDK